MSVARWNACAVHALHIAAAMKGALLGLVVVACSSSPSPDSPAGALDAGLESSVKVDSTAGGSPAVDAGDSEASAPEAGGVVLTAAHCPASGPALKTVIHAKPT